MKQNLLRAVFFASILLTATACNDDDDDNGNSGPTPVNYTFKADLAFPFEQDTPDEVWSSMNVTATQRLDGSFQMIALSDGDSLVITTLGREVNFEYELDSASAAFLFSDLADENYYVRADGTKYGIVTSESSSSVFYTSDDTASNTISGIFNIALDEVIPTGPGGVNELVTFLNGEITDLPYTTEDFDIGEPGGGSLSLVADGSAVNFTTVTGFSLQGAVSVVAAAGGPTSFPTFGMILDENLTPGTYQLGSSFQIIVTYSTSENVNYTPQDGEMVITTNANGTLIGTFFFTGEDSGNTIDITQGVFNINY